jgi:hypothetical protein
MVDWTVAARQSRDKIKAPENVDSDHFTWWFDETEQSQFITEVASMAWFTVVNRFVYEFDLNNVPNELDKYGFNEWFSAQNFKSCSPYEVADMAWMKAKEEYLKYLNK